MNGVALPSLVKITFNKGTEEFITPVISYWLLIALRSAYVNEMLGTGVGPSLLQLKTDTAIKKMVKILFFNTIFLHELI